VPVLLLVELPGEQVVRVGHLIEEALGRVDAGPDLTMPLSAVDPDAIGGDLAQPGTE
jgi:hypothetical protein